jgi:hypothetical protein
MRQHALRNHGKGGAPHIGSTRKNGFPKLAFSLAVS